MGRAPCCDKANVKKGPWSPEEDTKLKEFIHNFGTGGNWIALPHKAGLKRCGKSCRLRWLNYLRPNIKHGEFSHEEDTIICTLFASIGSRWSIIAAQLPGRTDNDIKNYWNTKLKKKLIGLASAAPSHKKPSQLQYQQHQPLFPSTTSATTTHGFLSATPQEQDHVFSSQEYHHQICSFGGNEHSGSGGGNSSDMSYERYANYQQQQMDYADHVLFDQSNFNSSDLYGGGAGQEWGSMSSEVAPLEYGYEEIKQLIANNSHSCSSSSSSSSCNIAGCNINTFVDDPLTSSAAATRGNW